ncbi:hypothetical protein ACLB2K_022957 [Fragaria x ananassa]
MAYSLWKQRNYVIFRNQTPITSKIVFSAANLFKQYPNCHLITSHKHSYSTTVFKWHPPPPNRLKLNFDGSVIHHSAASGFIFQNSDGNPILASTKQVGKQDILTAEALALRASLIAAWYHNFTHFQVEGDSKTLIDSINGTTPCPRRILTIVRDIKHLALLLQVPFIQHIKRDQNFVADTVTKLGHTTSVQAWNASLPLSAS